jgi:hypothetical protein
VRFKITDSNTGQPLTNLRPAAWIDQRTTGPGTDAKECREKVQSFLQPGFNRSASVDLNKYFILALNSEPNISVIDPTSGFGGSKLYTLVGLRSPGEDWVLSADKKRLYVSMPEANQLRDRHRYLEGGCQHRRWVRPARIALQHDNRYLWVGNNSTEERTAASR